MSKRTLIRYVATPFVIVMVLFCGARWGMGRLNDTLLYGNASPLHRAIVKGDEAEANRLLGAGADIHQRMYAPKNPDTWDATPLHLAARLNRTSLVDALIQAGADKNSVDRLGFTPLHGALNNGANTAAQLLIQAGAVVHAPTNCSAYAIENCGQPLRTAFENASIDTVQALIGAGADPAIAMGDGAMGWVNRPDFIQKVQLLLDRGFSIDGPAEGGRRALHRAATNGDVEAIRFLIDQGANIEIVGGSYGFTPLLSAAYAGTNDVIKVLLERGANPHAAATNFGSVLYVAAFEGHKETVRLLLSMNLGIDIQAGRESDKATPLHLAYWNGDQEMIQLLIAAGADENARTSDGRTPPQFRR